MILKIKMFRIHLLKFGLDVSSTFLLLRKVEQNLYFFLLHIFSFETPIIYLLQSFKLRHNGHNGFCSLFLSPSFVILYQQSLQTL